MRLKPNASGRLIVGAKAPTPDPLKMGARGLVPGTMYRAPTRDGAKPESRRDLAYTGGGHDCVVPLQGSAYFFSICSFKCLAQASAVVCWPWRVFFLSTE